MAELQPSPALLFLNAQQAACNQLLKVLLNLVYRGAAIPWRVCRRFASGCAANGSNICAARSSPCWERAFTGAICTNGFLALLAVLP